MAPGPPEIGRQLLHAAVGGLALLLPFVGTGALLVVVLGLILWTGRFFPRLGGRRLFRESETLRGRSSAMVLYPVAIAVVLAVWHDRPEVVMGAWVLLAVGDAAATLAGETFGGSRLPWNREATFAGSAAFVLTATPAVAAALALGERHGFRAPEGSLALWGVAGALALAGAVLESLPLPIDDNLRIPIGGAFVLDALLAATAPGAAFPADLGTELARGAVLNGVLAVLLVATGAADRRGALVGAGLGTAIWAGGGPGAQAVLVLFVATGTAATRLGWRRKSDLGLAERNGGRRGVRNALANLSVAAVAGIFGAVTGDPRYALGLVGALAAALADTLSSEVGQAWGGTPRLVTTGRPVEAGADGGVTWLGSSAGVLGATATAAVATSTGVLGLEHAPAVLVAGVLGGVVDSLLGATLERRRGLDNESVNLLATLAGAVVAVQGAALIDLLR